MGKQKKSMVQTVLKGMEKMARKEAGIGSHPPIICGFIIHQPKRPTMKPSVK